MHGSGRFEPCPVPQRPGYKTSTRNDDAGGFLNVNLVPNAIGNYVEPNGEPNSLCTQPGLELIPLTALRKTILETEETD